MGSNPIILVYPYLTEKSKSFFVYKE